MSSSSSLSLLDQVYSTFVASIRSVGTACTLAAVGVYLHRRGFVVGDGKRTLALISQQVTIPLLFFTKILFCNQDWSDEACPDITQSLQDVWVLLVWPAYVVGVGLAIGYAAARLSRTPSHQVRAVLVACGFGNSTGLPITLLTVVHSQFPSDTDLGRIDPTLFLSVYLLLYPVLQWGIGGWLLAPEEEGKQSDLEENHGTSISTSNIPSSSGRVPIPTHDFSTTSSTTTRNVLNMTTSDSYNWLHRGMGETDASMYMSVPDNLYQLERATTRHPLDDHQPNQEAILPSVDSYQSIGMTLDEERALPNIDDIDIETEETALLAVDPKHDSTQQDSSFDSRLWDTIQVVLGRCLQPPVVGALLGMLVASQPWLRGLLVDLVDRGGHAPLQWFFDGLHSVGQTAVPINMMILGCNLSASYENTSNKSSSNNDKEKEKKAVFSQSTTVAILVGKMVVMPLVGFLSAYLLKTWWWETRIPDEIGGSFYLVVMIVFLTPTANNVMVMVELSSGGGSGGSGNSSSNKEGMARIIAWQYMAAPLILSVTMTVAVCIAVQWS
jgi:predicted permease